MAHIQGTVLRPVSIVLLAKPYSIKANKETQSKVLTSLQKDQ